MNSEIPPRKLTYAGLFLVTLATLMYEILLTRIFSVTMFYHFAFVAISIAMFGMTVGSLLVYLYPSFFALDRLKNQLTLFSILFAVSMVTGILTHLSMPIVIEWSGVVVYSLVVTYLMISLPFVFSGICVSLVLTRFPRQVSKLYAADLIGAATGCVLLVYLLGLTDGPSAVVVVACLACVAAVCFGAAGASSRLRYLAAGLGFLLAVFAYSNTMLGREQKAWLRVEWVKSYYQPTLLYEKWNSFSRVAVSGNPNDPEEPFGWGISPIYPAGRKVSQMWLDIDGKANTVMTGLQGDHAPLNYLRYDLANAVHYIRSDASVLVVGSGGGRDVLSALLFDQRSVLAVEINEDIIKAVNQRYGDFTGHLDRNPKVHFVADEARSYIARSKDRYDIIQVSLIDTWAATAAGAYVLTENSLYTVEGWKIFLNHLNPSGVLTFSRWYFRDSPGEMYRLTSLASEALMQTGVTSPREHIIILRRMGAGKTVNGSYGMGTMVVCKTPFSARDIDTLESLAQEMQFEIVLTPRLALDPNYVALTTGVDLDRFTANFPIDISPPTDNRPFFFHMLRARDVFKPRLWNQGSNSFNMVAVFVLGSLFLLVMGFTGLCIFVPLVLTVRTVPLRLTWPHFLFFGVIGLGFMLVEISQMQRLVVFLGHPVYGLSVVLFALLLSSGLGSFTTRGIAEGRVRSGAIQRLTLLLGALVIFGLLTPRAMAAFQASTTLHRILVAAGLLFPLGLFMGMAFPLGMKLAARDSSDLTPWLWGINGAASVCASVVAVVIAMTAGISASFWTGFACYAIALFAFARASRGLRSRHP
jgi:hypothetical protein